MQDVRISLWPEGDGSGMIVKVMDICSTDLSDPSNCATPAHIKADGAKVQTLYPVPSLGLYEPICERMTYLG